MAEKILRLLAVLAATGLCRSAVYAGIKAGTFPKPVALGLRSVGWRESVVLAWMASRPTAEEVKRPRLAEADDRPDAR
jgi:prophage regulatory protein